MRPEDRGDPLSLLKELIRCPSVTPEEAGAIDLVADRLAGLGFSVERLRFEGNGSYPVDNLFAIRERGGRRLLFAGHTDVVPPGDIDAWRHPPFAATEENGEIFGRGAADMKSGIAAFIAAVERAVASGAADRGTLALAITNDEEADSVNGTDKIMEWAAARGHRFDFAIVGEPSSAAEVGDSIKIGRRGSLNCKVTVAGAQGHVAYPERANNPLPVAAAVVTALAGAVDGGTPHFPPSNLEVTSIDVGNRTSNLIPAQAQIRFNVRFNDLWTPDRLEAHLRDRLAAVDARGCQMTLERVGTASSAFLSPLGEPVELLARVIEAQIGRAPQQATGGGTSDARFIAPYCPVVECGIVGPTLHKVDEKIAIADLHALTRLYHAFVEAFLQAAP